MPAPIAPWMSASEALTIWMLRTAMKAPSVEPMTAIHILSEPAVLAASSAGAREIDGAAAGSRLRALAGAVMAARSMAEMLEQSVADGAWRMIGRFPRQFLRSGAALGQPRGFLGQPRGFGVDGRLDRHAGAQQTVQLRVIDRDFHRNALDDLGEIAGGVVGRQ